MLEFFRALPMFSDVPGSALETLCRLSQIRHYKKNDVLVEQETDTSTVFFVKSGLIKLVHIDEEGRECIHRMVGEGFVLPGTSLFYHDPLPEFVYSVTDTTILEVSQTEFERWIEPYSTALIQLAGEMNRRLYHMYEWSHQLAVSDAEQRVHYFLEQLVSNFGRMESDGVHINLPVTQTEIAQMVGVRRESLNRILKELQRKKVLHLRHQAWVVSLDWQTQIC
ncbi:Crp/Fnr family transcriptional regulator [Alicyclobacillus sp. SO9]|uniref:Crp/Fnr family transcriptional regulator n=1 Tax=Alicyclobacillus sp. SO9 TaxID=2665646 RepID=UPI0018E70D5E|nr:Crp/Fnr family transcriptional regulator [Alicyclobacillus sp. SO9]QQE77244.1 Crp/Fnr family transcriptional regulator [Alicyclobacillus sp. SO9]